MHKIPPQQERALNIVIAGLLVLTMLLFAGVPAAAKFTKSPEAKASNIK